MSKISSVALGAAVVGCVMSVVQPASANAGPSPSPSGPAGSSRFAADNDADLQRRINSHIFKYGGKQRGKNQIVWEKQGAIMTFPTPAATNGIKSNGREPCRVGFFCIYEHAFWDRDGGSRVGFFKYGVHKLDDFGWQDRVSSWENNQTGNAGGSLWDENSGQFFFLDGGRAYSDRDYIGADQNDRADYLQLFK